MTLRRDHRRWLEAARLAWDERADQFDARSSANATSEDRVRELDRVAATLELAPGRRVLDAGCGAGHFAIALAQRGCQVDGIDLSPQMIARARSHAGEAGVHVRFTVGDLTTLRPSDRPYDAIVSRMALQFSPDVSAALDAFERVSAIDSRWWLAVPGALSPIYRHSWQRFVTDDLEPVNYIVPWELDSLLALRGWTVVDQWGSFDSIAADAQNVLEGIEPDSLPIPLQQAAATVWNVVVRRA